MLRMLPRRRCLSRAVVLRRPHDESSEADTLGCVIPPLRALTNTTALRVQLALNGIDFVDEALDGLSPRYLHLFEPFRVGRIEPPSAASDTPLIVSGEGLASLRLA